MDLGGTAGNWAAVFTAGGSCIERLESAEEMDPRYRRRLVKQWFRPTSAAFHGCRSPIQGCIQCAAGDITLQIVLQAPAISAPLGGFAGETILGDLFEEFSGRSAVDLCFGRCRPVDATACA